MAEQFKHYSVNDFDRFDCVRLSKVIYLSLAYLLRGYLVWLMTITNFNNQTGIIEFIYPDAAIFYLNLMSGIFGLLVLLLISLRRPNASAWVKKLWPNVRLLLVAALIIDMLVVATGYLIWQLTDLTVLFGQLLVAAVCIVLCMTSKRLKLNSAEFPEPLPEK